MTLEEKVNWTNKIANGVSLITHGMLTFWNEHQQSLAKAKEIPYETYMGYVSDYAAMPMWCALVFLTGKFDRTFPFFYAAGYTAIEFVRGGNIITGGTFDPLDIPCYWLGAGVAYGIHKVTGGK